MAMVTMLVSIPIVARSYAMVLSDFLTTYTNLSINIHAENEIQCSWQNMIVLLD